jgi:ankyrin repeat protein
VEALIKKYADIDIKGKDNKTCLHWAIDKNHTAIVKLLLSANPDLVKSPDWFPFWKNIKLICPVLKQGSNSAILLAYCT